MTQDVILKNFKKYLAITSNKYLEELEVKKSATKNAAKKIAIDKKIKEHKAYIRKLNKTLLHSHDYAFSICHAAMDSIGTLKWWESVLVKLANWDGSEKALQQYLNLPNTTEMHTLDHLFNCALNYIVYHQVNSEAPKGFKLRDTEQDNILKPANKNAEKKRFLLINGNQPALFIKNSIIAAGYFTQADLLALLDKNFVSVRKNMCLISSYNHTIRIGYDGQVWMVYDPDYNHLLFKVDSSNIC